MGGGGRRSRGGRNLRRRKDEKRSLLLTWVASRALGESVGQVGQLAHMVSVLQGTHVHVVPPAKLTEPEALLLGFGVRVQHDAHPQGSCRDTRPDTQHSLRFLSQTQSSLSYGEFSGCFCGMEL